MKDAIEEIVHDLVTSAGRNDVVLDLSFSGNMLVNIRQASPLVLVVYEIVTNALKYGLSSAQPRLIVSVIKADDEMTLEIRDNGPGISPNTTEKKSGLGSYIIEGLVSQMRGKIHFQSGSSGTTITLKVPAKSQSSD